MLLQQRGRMKEEEFVKKMQEIMTEEEKQRIPIAQGLPWTTDEPEVGLFCYGLELISLLLQHPPPPQGGTGDNIPTLIFIEIWWLLCCC